MPQEGDGALDVSTNTEPVLYQDLEARRQIAELRLALNQRTIEPTVSVAQFFEKTNALKTELDTHQQHLFLCNLLDKILHGVIKHCEQLIPLASGHYMPHGPVSLMPTIIPIDFHGQGHEAPSPLGQGMLEVSHELSHLIGHGTHWMLHGLHIFQLIHVLEVAQVFIGGIPFFAGIFAGLVKIIE